jgi:phenylalanyl-tRNA synthetase alpha chain
MEQQVEALRGEALADIAAATDRATLEAARIRYLGKSGAVTAISEGMRNVAKEDRSRFGKLNNDLRQAVTQALDDSERLLLQVADSCPAPR